MDVSFKGSMDQKSLRTPALDQWFSTSGSWRSTKQNKTLFGDPYITIIALK